MFHSGLESSGARSEEINLLRQSEYISQLLKRKADDISKLMSILLYICSDEPEIDSERQLGTYPSRPKPVKTKKDSGCFRQMACITGLWEIKQAGRWVRYKRTVLLK